MLTQTKVDLELTPNQEFANLASDEQIERTVKALEANGIHAVVAENGEEAKRIFFELVPEGAEVFLGASVTLETLGIKDEIDKSGRYDLDPPKDVCDGSCDTRQGNPQAGWRAGLRGRQCPCRDRGLDRF